MRSTQKTETSSAGKQNPSTTEKKPLKVKVETVLIIIAMTGLVLTGITIGIRIHHHQMSRDIRIKFEQLHDRYKKCLNLAALEMNSDHNRNFKVEAL